MGGSGTVGRAAVRALRGLGPDAVRLRLGGRRPRALREMAEAAGPVAEAVPVDCGDPAGLAAFCAGCRVVLNCAGPSYLLLDRVARAALTAGADYVDVAGDDPVHERLATSGLMGTARTAVLSAGILPGLSGLLPRWLARTAVTPPRRLSVWAGGLEPCGTTVATDLVLSLDRGGSQGAPYAAAGASWREGRPTAGGLRGARGVELPFFPGPVTIHPALSGEAVRLATGLGLSEVDWFSVFAGDHLYAALTRLRAHPPTTPARLAAAAAEVVRAADLDLVGRAPYYRMLLALDGVAASRTAVLAAVGSHRITGAMGALAVAAVLSGEVPTGLHYAADALDPVRTVDALREVCAPLVLEVFDGPPAECLDEVVL
ncbi:saccharopine dehydrogenase NADP-binding domain-containing protein [Streptomyces celluloflavus]|uniref:saccharopine dehydrogenase NADP-binding domain-containing protein n=1 Tax=Streptomyces celluloflavus TaxID=58344 RepID=UPI00367D778F